MKSKLAYLLRLLSAITHSECRIIIEFDPDWGHTMESVLMTHTRGNRALPRA